MNVICITYLKFFVLASICSTLGAQVSISNLKQEDIPEVVALIKNEWSKLFMQPSYDSTLVNRMLIYRHPGDFMNMKELFVKVARENTHLAGFITYYFPNVTTVHIELLAVDKAFRKRGVGKKLIDQVWQEACNKGTSSLQLFVYTTNPNAIEFYTHLGFTTKMMYPTHLLLAKSFQPEIITA